MLINYKSKKIFAFSDTHGMNNRLEIPEDVDILISCGDCARDGIVRSYFVSFLDWFSKQAARYKIFVPGNHDIYYELFPDEAKALVPSSITLLDESGIIIDGISLYGVACRPWRFTGSEYALSEGIDFLISHAPSQGILDNNSGCGVLRHMVDTAKPKYHIFGHIHERGLQQAFISETTYLNVSYYNKLLYHYPIMKEKQNLENGVIKGIEEDIISSYNTNRHYENDKCLLKLRQHLINDIVLAHQEDIIEALREFNDVLMEALKELYDRGKRIYDDLKAHGDYGDEVDVKASLYLDNVYPELHPIQGDDRQDLWEAICDGGWNVLYEEGISFYVSQYETFDSMTGMDCPPPNWNEGLDSGLTKDMHLCRQFHHLFDHTEFAITDFIYVRDFHSEIKINIRKGFQDNGE